MKRIGGVLWLVLVVAMVLAAAPVYATTVAADAGIRLSAMPNVAAGGSTENGVHKKMVSMEFQNADLVSVVRLLAKAMDVNVIVDPAMHGEVTMTLKNVSAEGALRLVLTIAGYDYKHVGNLIVVGSTETLARMKDVNGHPQVFSGPVKVMVIPLEFARAAAIADIIKGIYPHLIVQPVTDSNVIVVRGPLDQLLYVRKLIKGDSAQRNSSPRPSPQ